MKYKYTGNGSVCVSSCGELKFVYNNDEVEFNEEDLRLQTLTNFIKVEETNTKTKKDKQVNEEDE